MTAIAKVDPLDPTNAIESIAADADSEWTKLAARFKTLKKAGALPAHVENEHQAIALARFGQSFGWEPMRSIRSAYLVKGSPCLKTEAMVALVREKLPQAQIYIALSNDEECIVKARRGESDQWNVYSFSMAQAKKAGLTRNGIWNSYPAIMLRWRALSQACRVEFPDATNGAYSLEEMRDAEFTERATIQRADYLPPELTGADQRPAIEAEDVVDIEPPEPGSIGEQVELGESPLVEKCDLCGKNPHDFDCPHWTEAD